MVLAATCAACDSGGSGSDGRGTTVTGVKGVDGSTWDVELLAVVRGRTTGEINAKSYPCLMMVGIIKNVDPDEFGVPVDLPITAKAGEVVSNGVEGVCSPRGSTIGLDDPFGQPLDDPIGPGTEISFDVGFADFEEELPDVVRLTIGDDGDSQRVIEARATDEVPPLRELAVGSMQNLAATDTEFQHVLDGEMVTQRVLGYDIAPSDDDLVCLWLYVRVEADIEVSEFVPFFSLLPRPRVVVDGVGESPSGSCNDSVPGYSFYFGPADPLAQEAPYGVMYGYEIAPGATVQAVMVEDGEETVLLAVQQLDGPPPAP